MSVSNRELPRNRAALELGVLEEEVTGLEELLVGWGGDRGLAAQ